MSQFAADVRIVTELRAHPDADRLELAKVNDLDYQMVVGKGEFVTGDRVLYLPLDAVLPDGLRDMIGLKKNRVKTIKLRGEISQGVLVPIVSLLSHFKIGTDLAPVLGITKYDAEDHASLGEGTRTTLPAGVSVYDIENAERFKAHAAELLAGGHVVTEKLEGTNFCAVLDEQNEYFVCSRKHTVDGDTIYNRVAEAYGIRSVLATIKELYKASHVSIHGEIIGPRVQGNYYDRPKLELYVFDIKVDHKWLDWLPFAATMGACAYHIPLVPVLPSYDPQNGGKSLLAPDKLREGVVIRPVNERYDHQLGRLILKFKNPEYLLHEKS